MSKSVLPIYRDPPGDIEYRRKVEAANCRWCRWRGSFFGIMETGFRSCKEPRSQTRPGGELIHKANPKGECSHYDPTAWTRLLRAIGLRRPAWREST